MPTCSATTTSTPSLLPTLTADDLRELGVASLGHRKQLLAAIAALAAATRSLPARTPAADGTAGRAPPAHGDVRRPGRLDRALGPPRPGGHARGPARLPEHGHGRDRARRRARGQADGRRRAGLLRLAPRARGRRRARRAGRAWRSSRRSAGSPRRPASRSRRGSASRPASWSWATSSARVPRGRRRWSARRRTWPRGCRRRPSPGTVVVADGTRRLLGEVFELRELGPHPAQGLRRPGARPSRCSASAPPRAASRPGGRAGRCADGRARPGAGAGARALAAGRGRRGPGGAAGRRGRHRQVAAGPRPCSTRSPASEHVAAPLPVLALPHRHARSGR